VATSGGTLSFVDRLQKYMYTVEAQVNMFRDFKWKIVGYEVKTNWVGLTRHHCTQLNFKWEIVGYEVRINWVGLSRHVLVSGLNHCVPLLSLFISI